MTSEEEAAEVLDLAVGTLQEWFRDYSPPFADGAQRRISPEEYHDDGMTFGVQTLGNEYDNHPRRFRARITLEAIE